MAEEATAVAAAPAAAAPAASAPVVAAAPAAAAPAQAAPAAAAPTVAPTAEAQPAAAAAAAPGEGTAAAAATPKPAAPEKYEFVAPEEVALDPTVMEQFSVIAKKLDLTQEAAQDVINQMAPLIVKNDTARIAALATEASSAWTASSKADKEFGGDKFDENRAIALKAFDAFGTPELKQLLIDSHLGDHPEVIRWAYRVGKHLGPDNKFVPGDVPTGDKAGTFEERAANKLFK